MIIIIGVKLSNEHLCDHVPKSDETSPECKVTILWNQQVRNDGTAASNKPDIIITDNKQGTRMLMDVAIRGDRNMIKKGAEKILIFENLIMEIQRMCNMKAKLIPVIIGEDRLCGLVVRVSGYRYRGLGFDSRRYRIFWVVVGLERCPLSLVRLIEELLELKSSGSGPENRD